MNNLFSYFRDISDVFACKMIKCEMPFNYQLVKDWKFWAFYFGCETEIWNVMNNLFSDLRFKKYFRQLCQWNEMWNGEIGNAFQNLIFIFQKYFKCLCLWNDEMWNAFQNWFSEIRNISDVFACEMMKCEMLFKINF